MRAAQHRKKKYLEDKTIFKQYESLLQKIEQTCPLLLQKTKIESITKRAEGGKINLIMG